MQLSHEDTQAVKRNCRSNLSALLCTAALLVCASQGRADLPVGDFHLAMGGADSIHDLASPIMRTDNDCGLVKQMGDVCVDLTLDLTFAVDARGRLSGDGSLTLARTAGDFQLAGFLLGPVSGVVRGNNDKGFAKVLLKAAVAGPVNANETPVQAKGTVIIKGEIDAGGTFTGVETVKVCLGNLGCGRSRPIPVVIDLSGGGSWNLDLHIVDIDGKKLGGDATATVGPATYHYTIVGRYNARRDVATLSLKPDAAARGSSIQVKNASAPGAALEGLLKYRLQGYRGSVSLGP